MPKLTDLDVPQLEGGWINLTEAASTLGVTRSYIYKLAARPADKGGLTSLRRVGSQSVYVVLSEEIEALKSGRVAPMQETASRELTLEELQAL